MAKEQQAQATLETLRLELHAADQTRARGAERAHVASLTMQTELRAAEHLTHQTRQNLADAQEAANVADVRRAAVTAELPLAESGSSNTLPAPRSNAVEVHSCFARLSAAIEEAQPHLQEQVRQRQTFHPPRPARPTHSHSCCALLAPGLPGAL